MHTSIVLFIKDKIIYKFNICRKHAAFFMKWSLAGLVFVLCLTLAATPVFAASAEAINHEDRIDSCAIVQYVAAGHLERPECLSGSASCCLKAMDTGSSNNSAAQESNVNHEDANNANNEGSINKTVFKLCVIIIELIILGILSYFIASDLRVIRWFEEKKKAGRSMY